MGRWLIACWAGIGAFVAVAAALGGTDEPEQPWTMPQAANGPATMAATAPADDEPATTPDEQTITKLIRELGGSSYRGRNEAQQKLMDAGPYAVAIIQRFRDDPDPEIAERVQKVLDQYVWVQKPLMVSSVRGSAVAAGVKVGDVLAMVDGKPLGPNDVLPEQGELTFCRSQRMFKVRLTRLLMLQYTRVQSLDDVAVQVGLILVQSRDYTAASSHFQRMLAAQPRSTLLLAAMAAVSIKQGRQAQALEYMAKFNQAGGSLPPRFSLLSEIPKVQGLIGGNMAVLRNMGLDDLQTKLYLQRLDQGKLSDREIEEMAAWFVCEAPNLDVARKLLALPLGEPDKSDDRWRLYIQSKARMSFFLRDWDAVIEQFNVRPCPATAFLAMQAALEKGDVVKACELGEYLAKSVGDRSNPLIALDSACQRGWTHAFAAAIMAGRDDLARKVLQEACKVEYFRNSLGSLRSDFSDGFMGVLCNPVIGPKLCEFVDEQFKPAMKYVTAIGALPDYSTQQWAKGKTFPKGHSYLRAYELLSPHEDRLKSDWAELNNAVSASDGFVKGSFWAVLSNGQPLYVDAQGSIHWYGGLLNIECISPRAIGYVADSAAGTSIGRYGQVYLLDKEKGQWVPTYTGFEAAVTEWQWTNVAAAMLKYVVKAYPVEGSGREVLASGKAFTSGRWFVLNGDIGITVLRDGDNYETRDLSKEIASAAGRGKPVAVYAMRQAGKRLLVPTELGLWGMDEQGKLARVELPLPKQDVKVVIRGLPQPDKTEVCIAVQQGGQVFEMRNATGELSATDRFCGQGPQDSFAMSFGNQLRFYGVYAIERIYRKHHPDADKVRATTPPGVESPKAASQPPERPATVPAGHMSISASSTDDSRRR